MSGYATFHDLKDASVFITGGGAGIGAALTEGFLAQGCQVAFVQRSDAHQFAARMGEKYERAPLFLRSQFFRRKMDFLPKFSKF